MVNLNAEQLISEAPTIAGESSTLPRSHGWTGSFNAGVLNCYFVDDMLPGDIVSIRASFFARMTTPYYPVYGDIFIDQYFFFVPTRLVLPGEWQRFNGENEVSAWVDSTAPTKLPEIDATSTHRYTGDLAHQMGITPRMPSAAASLGYGKVLSLPFRAYRLIGNSWFRNENYTAPKLINFGISDDTDYTLFDLYPVTRAKDFFGTLLPDQQKGTAVKIALKGYAPVYPIAELGAINTAMMADTRLDNLKWTNKANGNQITTDSVLGIISTGSTYTRGVNGNTSSVNAVPRNLAANFNKFYDDNTGVGVGIDVAELRQKFQLQRCLERLARSGSRYVESIRAFFGIVSPDARQQRPELLAHRRVHVRMMDVTQSAPQVVGEQATPLGTVGAYSKTADNQLAFTHSFSEHGYLLGVFCARHARSYSQGQPRLFQRKTYGDYYLPPFAHVSEQPVPKWRIYSEGSDGNDIIGFQEAWSDGYRYFESVNCGLLDPGAELDSSGDPSGLGAVWTYGDYYKTSPTIGIGSSWFFEGDAEIKRTLAIQNEDQFIADVWFDYKHTRKMPVHSVPGLVDHF